MEYKEKINLFSRTFHRYILLGIETLLDILDGKQPDRTARDKAVPYVSAVILISCAIDYLSKFRYGQVDSKDPQDKSLKDSDCYKQFVGEYFIKDNTASGKTYNKDLVYHGIRCALAHGYSLGQEIALTHEEKYKDKHTEKEPINGKEFYIFDVFFLYYDLQRIIIKYIEELQGGKHLQEFEHRWAKYPFVAGFITT